MDMLLKNVKETIAEQHENTWCGGVGLPLEVRPGTPVTSWLGRRLPQCCCLWQGSCVCCTIHSWVKYLLWGLAGHVWCRAYTHTPHPKQNCCVFLLNINM